MPGNSEEQRVCSGLKDCWGGNGPALLVSSAAFVLRFSSLELEPGSGAWVCSPASCQKAAWGERRCFVAPSWQGGPAGSGLSHLLALLQGCIYHELLPAAAGGSSPGTGSSAGFGAAPHASPSLRGPCSPALPCYGALGPQGHLAGGSGFPAVASHWVSVSIHEEGSRAAPLKYMLIQGTSKEKANSLTPVTSLTQINVILGPFPCAFFP